MAQKEDSGFMPFHGHTKIASIYRATIDEKDCNTSLKKKKKDL